MARSYANIVTAIWTDREFCALSAGAQRTYFMLITQPDIAACGTLPLTMRRWAGMVSDGDELQAWLNELAAAEFVIVDEATEELLVRTFVKHDGGYKHSKRLAAVWSTAEAIRSHSIRAALVAEARKLGLEIPSGLAIDCQSDANAEANRFGRVVVTEGELDPQPTTHTPQPTTRVPAATAAVVDADAPTAQTIVGEWVDRCDTRPPGRVVGQVAKLVGEMLDEGIGPDDIRRGIAAWMTKGLHPSTLPSVVNEVMNAAPRGQPRRRDTDDRVRDGLALAQRLATTSQPSNVRQIGAVP